MCTSFPGCRFVPTFCRLSTEIKSLFCSDHHTSSSLMTHFHPTVTQAILKIRTCLSKPWDKFTFQRLIAKAMLSAGSPREDAVTLQGHSSGVPQTTKPLFALLSYAIYILLPVYCPFCSFKETGMTLHKNVSKVGGALSPASHPFSAGLVNVSCKDWHA